MLGQQYYQGGSGHKNQPPCEYHSGGGAQEVLGQLYYQGGGSGVWKSTMM